MGFCVIDCVLEYPDSDERIEVMEFRYADIYEESLTERVETANRAAKDYYDAMDKERAE